MQTLFDAWSDFRFIPAADFADDVRAVPDHEGLYLLCFSESSGLPARAREVSGRHCEQPEERSVVYIGCSNSNIRARLDCHLLNTAWVSCFRKTTGLLMREPLGLQPRPGADGGRNWAFGYEGEAILTDWMLSDALIGFRMSDDPIGEERELIQRVDPILNIEGRRRTAEGRRLISLLQTARAPRINRRPNRVGLRPLSGEC